MVLMPFILTATAISLLKLLDTNYFCASCSGARPFTITKAPLLGLLLWCSIEDDYRTLAELEGVSVVNLYNDIDEEENDEWRTFTFT
jgi:hypothetical protein